jgi:hypothetical protein
MLSVGTTTGTASGRRFAAMGCVVALVAALGSSVFAAEIANPSFQITYEGTPEPRPLPENWECIDCFSFNSYCSDLWSTDGDLAACLFSLQDQDIYKDSYQSFWQWVDLTDVNGIVFDAMLQASDGGTFGPFTASFIVTPVETGIEWPLWTQIDAGEYLDQVVDVSSFTGVCVIELRLTATEDCWFDDVQYAAFWDNLGFCEPSVVSTIGASIYLDPPVLHRGRPGMCGGWYGWDNPGRWITCFIELPDGYNATQIDGSTVFLENLTAHMGWEWWARPAANPANITDIDRDGIVERMVRFERADVEAIVAAPETTVTVRGLLLDGTVFEGTAVIQVMDKGPGRPPWQCRPAKPPINWRFHGPVGHGGSGGAE